MSIVCFVCVWKLWRHAFCVWFCCVYEKGPLMGHVVSTVKLYLLYMLTYIYILNLSVVKTS